MSKWNDRTSFFQKGHNGIRSQVNILLMNLKILTATTWAHAKHTFT